MNKLQEIIQKNNIHIVKAHIDNCKGCYIKYKDLNIIAIEPTLSHEEELAVLKHELGHFLASATYSINETDILKIKEVEKIADNTAKKLDITKIGN